MASIYTTNGELIKSHTHKLIRLLERDQFGNRYRCTTCCARLKNKSGIVLGTEHDMRKDVDLIAAARKARDARKLA